ncbi:MAG: Na/Pi cotransporter family protein [Myxococcales bacterium]|nr:Na/Pi cotransporter family protein [Myxococcales bacterium]
MNAVAAPAASIEWLALLMSLFGGLALFLFGLEQMTAALKAVAGDRLRLLLSRLTVNRFAGIATGAFTTSIIQSSSVTTVLVVSFISSGVMTLSQSVGVIVGANIGTTITAQIVAFKVTQLAFLFVAVGFAVGFVAKHERLRQHGNGMLGLGLVFLGMTVMSDAMQPLRDSPAFIQAMLRMESPLIGIVVSMLFTGLVQSSSATTAVVISMASQGLITLPAGIALMLGANVGTCITALLAAIGKPEEAVRAAWVHVLFNLLGVAVWFGFIDELARLVVLFSPASGAATAVDRLAAETPRQIANAHTVFNLANAFLFVPFTGTLAWLAERLVPDRPIEAPTPVRVEFLDRALLGTPALALDQARREICHLGTLVIEMFVAVLPAMTKGTARDLDRIQAMDEPVDRLYDRIVEYLGRISQTELTQAQTNALLSLMAVTNAVESIGDLVETDLVSRGRQRVASNTRISAATQAVIEEFHREVEDALRGSLDALAREDGAAARAVARRKPQIQTLAEEAVLHGAGRLVAQEENRLLAYGLEMDVIEDLRRVFYFARRVAKNVSKLAKQNGTG